MVASTECTVLEVSWRDMERLSMQAFVNVWTSFNERYACYFVEKHDLDELYASKASWEHESRELVRNHTEHYREVLDKAEAEAEIEYVYAREQADRLQRLEESEWRPEEPADPNLQREKIMVCCGLKIITLTRTLFLTLAP